jgi:hypothetical protein
MSKRIDISGINPDLVIEQAKKSNREQKPEPVPPPTEPQAAPEETPEPGSEPVIVVEPVKEPETPKEESKRRKNKAQEYETLFFKDAAVKTRSGKVVYIRKEYHDRILKIVRVIGENEFSLFAYLDNLLEHHFNTYQDEITELYRKKNTDVF